LGRERGEKLQRLFDRIAWKLIDFDPVTRTDGARN
jgi:hypothetical protein